MASTTQDDGFHEIQLNGKQLVFLFMAVTVVSVVIFLSGVLVGRGVRLARGESVTAEAGPSMTGEQVAAPPVDSGNPPITKEEGLQASDRLGDKPPAEAPLKEGEEPSAKSESVPDSPPVASSAAAEMAPPPVEAKVAPVAPSAPAGKGLEIQLSAFRDRKGADTLATRLNSMGFTAYVVPPSPGAPALFRVRVGKFKERREADDVAARLKKEKFDPWILP
jgi:cell division septation protein DedD